MRLVASTFAVALLAASVAHAKPDFSPVYQALKAQGYTNVQTIRERNRVRFEAHQGTQTRVIIYDARSGRMLSDNMAPVPDQDRDRLRDRDRDHDRLQDPDQDRDRDRLRDKDQDRDRDRLKDPDQDQDRDRLRDQDRDNTGTGGQSGGSGKNG